MLFVWGIKKKKNPVIFQIIGKNEVPTNPRAIVIIYAKSDFNETNFLIEQWITVELYLNIFYYIPMIDTNFKIFWPFTCKYSITQVLFIFSNCIMV